MNCRTTVALLAAITVLTAGETKAQTFPKVEELTTICLATTHAGLCQATVKNFHQYYVDARKGNYQAQRNVSFCLSTGCDGAVTIDPVEACAWRMIIQGTAVRKEPTERTMYETACKLPSNQRREALSRAEAMFEAIYRKQLPIEKLVRD